MKAHSVGTFVQVGMRAINLALVEEIEILSHSTHLHYRNKGNSTDIPVVLVGDEHVAFLDWWERQAAITQDVQSPPRLVRPLGTSAWRVTPGE